MKRTYFYILLICTVVLCLCSCAEEVAPAQPIGSQIWETMPTLAHGVLSADPLEISLWNSGRCEATANYKMAETAQGFYLAYNSYLFYADKSALAHWVPLCSRPECNHMDSPGCTAKLQQNRFLVQNNRIYYEVNSLDYSHLHHTEASGYFLLSMAPNGTDQRLECVIDDALVAGGKWGTILDGTQWLYLSQELDNFGGNRIRFFRATDEGITEISLSPHENAEGYLTAGDLLGYFGDRYFENLAMESGKLYRFENSVLVSLDLEALSHNTGYLSGNTLRYMVTNDGYYDLAIDTGEVTKLSDFRIPNSHGIVVLPNCTVESTLFFPALKHRISGMIHSMEIHDGSTWHSVILPEDLLHAASTGYLLPPSITSDSIWFLYRDDDQCTAENGYPIDLYRIPLDAEEWALEYCGTITCPHE